MASGADSVLDRLASAGIRIHVHTDNAAFSGSEEGWTHLVSRYRTLGGEVTVTWRPSRDFDTAVRARLGTGPNLMPLELPREGTLPFALPRWVRAVRTMAAVFRQADPHVIHINNGGWPGSLSALAAGAAAGRRPALMVVNNLAYPYSGPRLCARPLERPTVRRITTFVTASRAAATQLESVIGLPTGTVKQIPNAIREPAAMPSRKAARQQLQIADDKLVAGCVARLEARKGHDVLFDSWADTPRADDAVLLVAGDGPLRDDIESRAADLRVRGYDIRVLGQVQDVWQVYAAADLLVLPSRAQEDMPLTLIEAMFAGRPVIASNVAGAGEVVRPDDTGLLVPPGDQGTLVQALSALLGDGDRREQMAVKARDRYLQYYSEEAMVTEYASLWERLSGGGAHVAR